MSRLHPYYKEEKDYEGEFIKVSTKVIERIQAINRDIYKYIIKNMDNEQLEQEFCHRIGNECNEYETMMIHYGRKFIEEYLIDYYEYCQYEEINK